MTQVEEKWNWCSSAAAVVFLPGQHEVRTGVVGPGACGAPLDCVDFFIVSLEVVYTRILFHTPDLCEVMIKKQLLRWPQTWYKTLFFKLCLIEVDF